MEIIEITKEKLLKKCGFRNNNYLDLQELTELENIIKKQKSMIKRKIISQNQEVILRENKNIEVYIDTKTPKWIQNFKESYHSKKDKVRDSSQYEIENHIKKEYPLELASGEIVKNKNEFLNSDYWNQIKRIYRQPIGRKEGIKRQYYTCEFCGSLETMNLHLHHLTYKNIGFEKAEELVRICYKCHSKIHGNEEKSKKEYDEQRRKITKEIVEGLGLESLFPFKKYKGLTVKEVIEKDKNYLKWIVENTDLKFNEEVFTNIMVND